MNKNITYADSAIGGNRVHRLLQLAMCSIRFWRVKGATAVPAGIVAATLQALMPA